MQCWGLTLIIFPLALFSTGFKATKEGTIKAQAGILSEENEKEKKRTL